MIRRLRHLLALAFVGVPLAAPSLLSAASLDLSKLPPAASGPVDFVRDIEPIFSRACAGCHGAEKQKGGYRLDSRSAALNGGDEHAPNIIPGKSADSPLIHFVAGLVDDLVMPAKGDRLTPAEIGRLRAWIDQGAVWPASADRAEPSKLDWWSLRPLVRPPVPPPAAGAPAAGNPVDAFIDATLASRGLHRAPEADRRTLIRRLTFDLTGLPPTPGEVDAFLGDREPDAYERLVDRLLASPRYGERWARHWLDVVHYGDTHGYDKDQPRPNAWPYRDYVIRAFNQDKPYGRFVEEQLAGDVLYPDTEDGVVALGFIAAGPWDLIGHAEVPESKIDGRIARALDRDDMVSNTLNTFCSVTVQCARCHNHKFDPVTQVDYYRLQAVFAALDRADKTYDLDPAIGHERVKLEARKRELNGRKRGLEADITKAGGKELEELDQSIAKAREAGKNRPEYGWHSAIEPAPDTPKWVQVDLGRRVAIAAIEYAGCHDDFNQIGDGFGFPPRFKVEIADDTDFTTERRMVEDQTGADLPNPGIKPRHIDAHGAEARFVRMTATRLAPRQNDYIFALAELRVLDAQGTNVALKATVTSIDSIEAPPRWTRANVVDGHYPGEGTTEPPADLARLEADRRALLERKVDPATFAALAGTTNELAQVQAALGKLPAPRVVYAGTVHYGSGAFAGTGGNGGQPRPIHVLARGDVQKPGREVGPGTLPYVPEVDAVFALPDGSPEGARRAALARWITDRRHPLTWRSLVNRVWQYHFGRALVDSPNDFGRMGQRPSHPELLDWLSVEFRDSGQSLKRLHRLLVTSATYRQVSSLPAADAAPAVAVDADNRLLWRMNRRKLEAEAVRDSLLAVAGKLDLTPGGPAFQDFVVDKPEHSPHYEYQRYDPEDAKTWRRSVYRFLVRSQPQPFMAALDCADPSMSVDRRGETLNALQALALRNNKLAVAMARHFASRVEAAAATPAAQVELAFRFALARPPTAAESASLTAYTREHGLPNTCRVILNLNEFAFVD